MYAYVMSSCSGDFTTLVFYLRSDFTVVSIMLCNNKLIFMCLHTVLNQLRKHDL